jgi:hypothetical protein
VTTAPPSLRRAPARRRALGRAVLLAALAPLAAAADPIGQPAPDPPSLERTPQLPPPDARGRRAPTTEWVLHRSADGAHPNGDEQQLVWLMNRARQDPTAEGVWLATSSAPDILLGRSFFRVDVELLESEFASLEPAPPAAFDRRLWDAARLHAEDMIARDEQDHDGQRDKLLASGFVPNGWALSAFAYAESALNAHAALNIDWGPGDGSGMQPGRGHRLAIMGLYDNVGLATVPEGSSLTDVGPLVFAGDYVYAETSQPDHYARFIVGTVWHDDDEDGLYDPGEGRGGVTVMPDHGPFYAVTAAGGGYAIPITAPGTYEVSFGGGGIGSHLRSASVGGESELLDLALVPEPSQALLALVGAALLNARGPLAARRRRRAPHAT